MSKQRNIVGILAIFITVGLTYWWYYFSLRIELQMEVIGIQGDVEVNGNKPVGENKTFNAHQAVIRVPRNGIFNGKLEDGSYIQITEDSQVTITQARRNKDSHKVRTKFVLDTGQIIRDIPKVETIGDYSSSLITTSVDIGIRGTRYAAIADAKQTSTMLYQGSVVLDSKGEDELTLQQGYGTITEKGKPTQPPSVLPPPPASFTSLLYKRITTRELTLNWQSVAEAKAYLVEVADDSEFRNLVYRKQVSSNQLLITGLPYDANFNWRVSSIDNRGLRGRPSQFSRFHYKYHHNLILSFDGSVSEATQLFEKALRGYSNDPSLIKDIGKYYYRTKQYQKALDYYNRAIAIEPGNDELLLERGRAYRALGKQPEAEKDFNNSLSLKTDSAGAFWNLGNVEADKGKLEDAIQFYYRAVAAQPDHAKAHLSAARAWEKLGRNDKAHRHLMLHLENFPNDTTVQQQYEKLSLGIEATHQGSTSK